MSSKVTDIDLHIAGRMREFRAENPEASMRKLASILGVKYQSYQAMEKGEVSIRVSSLRKLALFYGVTMEEFLGENPPSPMPNIGRVQYLLDLMKSMPADAAQDVLRHASILSRETADGNRL